VRLLHIISVSVCGIGASGVGSWLCEALARTGQVSLQPIWQVIQKLQQCHLSGRTSFGDEGSLGVGG
jgi:hypothetical protein